MKKYTIIISLITVIIIVAFAGVSLYINYVNRPIKDKETGRGYIKTQSKIDFITSGKTIRLNDFLSYPIRNIGNNVFYLYDGLDFGITYWKDIDKFYISISEQPVRETSLIAEQKFTELLGITESDACKLPVVVNGHYSTDDQFLNDREYQLSICPGEHLE